jgi:predicted nucleic acid-binding protein
MKKLKLYLDTSVLNFLFAEDAPDFKNITVDFFENYVAKGKYDVYISNVVIREIEKAPDISKRNILLNTVKKYSLRILMLTPEAVALSELYLSERIIPAKKREDAQHIAIAVCNQIDVLVSWNFKHLANIQKQLAVKIVNEQQGYYYPLVLTNPMEVLYENN